MQSIPQMSFGLDMSWLLLAVAVAIGFGVIAPLLRRVPESFRLSALVKLAAIALFVVAVAKWSHTLPVVRGPQETNLQFAKKFGGATLIPPAPEEISAAPSEASSAAPSTEPNDESGIQLPDWTKDPMLQAGSRKMEAVKSGRFATPEEALLHAQKIATNVAALEFRHLDPKGTGDPLPQHADEVQRTAIRRKFLEVGETNYGQFKGPSYQQWLELELTPELGERLAAPWRQSAVDSRVRTLAGWGIWMTGVAGLASFALRLDAAWNGRHRVVLTLAALVAAAGGLAFVA